eukprot:317066-Chlamydomonas_euryale.AAC.1
MGLALASQVACAAMDARCATGIRKASQPVCARTDMCQVWDKPESSLNLRGLVGRARPCEQSRMCARCGMHLAGSHLPRPQYCALVQANPAAFVVMHVCHHPPSGSKNCESYWQRSAAWQGVPWSAPSAHLDAATCNPHCCGSARRGWQTNRRLWQ